MTLGIVLGNADQIIQATDRRLTSTNGTLFDDSANKSGHFLCDDASLLYCFTGLATLGSGLTTSDWLLEALRRASQKGHTYGPLTWGLKLEAEQYFHSSRWLRSLPASARRLTIMLTGYDARDRIVNILLSNFQDFERFVDYPEAQREFMPHLWLSSVPANHNPTLIQVIGQFSAFTPNDEAELRDMLERRVGAEGIRQKAISLIRSISDRPKSRGTVGKRINTGRISFAAPSEPHTGHSSDVQQDEIPMHDQIDLRQGSNDISISQAKITARQPVVFPKVHRNAPCPCGSGKRYRDCHRSSAR